MTTRPAIMQSFSVPISIAVILIGGLATIAVVLTVGFVLHGPSPMFDFKTLLLSLAVISLLGGFLACTRGAMFAQGAMLTFYFILFVLPRVAQYLLVPDLLSLPYGQGTGVDDVNVGLTYLLLGTVAMIVGFMAADRWLNRSGRRQTADGVPAYPVLALMGIFTCVLAVDFYITFWMNVGVFGNYRAEVGNTVIQLLRSLFSVDIAFFVILTSVMLASRLRNRGVIVVMLIIAYSLYLGMQGSRVGGLRVVSMVLPILLVGRGNFRILPRHLAGFLLFVTALNVAMFPLATQTRNNMVARHLEHLEQVATTRQLQPVTPVVQTIQQARQGVSSSEGLSLYAKPARLAMTILDRMGAVDYTVQVLTAEGNLEAKARFMSFSYASKSIINAFVPGALFPDAELSTSRSPSVIYRGLNVSHLSGYFSEYWTAWGLAFVMLGWWGGLLGLLVAGFVIHAGYLAMLGVAQGFKYYLGALWLFIVSLHFYLSMGLDHAVTTAVVAFLQAGVVLVAAHRLWAGVGFHQVRSQNIT